MRFRQLNHDPNTIERKKLVKSGKNWIVISSLMVAAGLLLWGTPNIVEADTVDTPATTENKVPSDESNVSTDTKTVTVNVYLKTNYGFIKTDTQITGKPGDTQEINVPSKAGDYVIYIPDGSTPLGTTQATISDDGTQAISADQYQAMTSADYQALLNAKAQFTATVPSNIGPQSFTVNGKPGDDVTITLPVEDGYTTDTKQIVFHINDDGTVSPINPTTVTYTKVNTDTTIDDNGNITAWNGSSQYYYNKDESTLYYGPGETTENGFMNSNTTLGRENAKPKTLKATDPSKTVYLNGVDEYGHFDSTTGESFSNIENFDTKGFSLAHSYTADSLFRYSKIKDLNLSNFNNNPLLATVYDMFYRADIQKLDINNFDVSNVQNMSKMFYQTYDLASLDISNWNMKNATDTSNMFDYSGLTQITLGKNNKFTSNTTLPTKSDEVWANVGSGTISNPEGNIVIKPGEELSTLYDGSGKTGTQTFVKIPNPELASNTVTILSNLTDQTITTKVSGNPNTDVEVSVPQLDGYTSDKSTVNVHINADGSATTTDKVTYSKTTDLKAGDTITLPLYLENGEYVGSEPSDPLTQDDITNLTEGIPVSLNFTYSTTTDVGNITYSNLRTSDSKSELRVINGKVQYTYGGIPSTYVPVVINSADVEFNYVNDDTKESLGSKLGELKDSILTIPEFEHYTGYIQGQHIETNKLNGLSGLVADKTDIDPLNTSLEDQIHRTVYLHNVSAEINTTIRVNIYVNNRLVDNKSITIVPYSMVNSNDPDDPNDFNGFDKMMLTDATLDTNASRLQAISHLLNISTIDINLQDLQSIDDIPTTNTISQYLAAFGLKNGEQIDSISTMSSISTLQFDLHYNKTYPDGSMITADVSIPSNEGTQIAKSVSGKVNTKIQVAVPHIDGYTPDKTTVNAVVNPDGTITTTDYVTYTKVKTTTQFPNHSSSSHADIQIEHTNQTVSTDPDQGSVTLYSLSSNNGTMTPVANRALQPNSNWFSDEFVNIKNIRYYRVATNEWVKASQSYVYKEYSTVVSTRDKVVPLFNSENQLVNNRALGPRSSWIVDKIAYLGDDYNPTTTYRVATNEFVKASDVDLNH